MCNINYHMVWSVKYRRKILNSGIEEYLKELVQQIAEDKGFTVHLFECGEGDHVHCFVTAPPKLSITAIVKYLKGITGRKLFERFLEIRNQLWKGELWNHFYYVETIGSIHRKTENAPLLLSMRWKSRTDTVGAFNILRKYLSVSGKQKELSVSGLKNPKIVKVAA